MKTCDEMVNSLFQRREQYLAEQKRKRRNAVIAAALYCCAFAVIGGIALSVKLSTARQTETVTPSSITSADPETDSSDVTTPEQMPDLPVVWSDGVDFRALGYWEHDVQEWNGKSISDKLYDALNKNDENCLFAVTAEYFWSEDKAVYNGKTVAQYREEARAKEHELFVLEKLLLDNGDDLKYGEALYQTGTPDGVQWGERLYKETVSMIGQDTIDKYIVDGVFLKDELLLDIEKVKEEYNTAYQAYEQAYIGYPTQVYETLGKQLKAKGNRYIVCDSDGIFMLMFISKDDLADLTLDNVNYCEFRHASKKNNLPIVWAEEEKIKGDTVSSLDYRVEWNGKQIHNRLWGALENNETNENCLFAVGAYCGKIRNQFVYNGKTLAQYEVEEDEKKRKVNAYDLLLREGEVLKYGEAVYKTGTPDGAARWVKELYDEVIAIIGEDMLSEYIVDGVFLQEKASQDLPKAEDELKTAQQAHDNARAAYIQMYEETVGFPGSQGILYELEENSDYLTLYLSKEEFANLTLDNMSDWTFFLAPKSEKNGYDTAVNE